MSRGIGTQIRPRFIGFDHTPETCVGSAGGGGGGNPGPATIHLLIIGAGLGALACGLVSLVVDEQLADA